MAELASIGDVIAGFAPEGPLRTLVIVTYGLCAAIALFIYKYYLGVLAQGAKPEGSIERQDYDKLRASLKEGNLAARLYAKWLSEFLDWIERFFGDANMADRTLFPHAFGLKKPAPLWTAPALDRCLLLALIYPIVTIVLFWAISGHVGPAESALRLRSDSPGLERCVSAAVIGGIGTYIFRQWHFVWQDALQTKRWKFVLWSVVFALATIVFGVVGVTGSVLYVSFAFGRLGYEEGYFPGVGPIACIAILAIAFASVGGGIVALIVVASVLLVFGGVDAAIFVAFAVVVAVSLSRAIAVEYRWQGLFICLILPAMIWACFGVAAVPWPLKAWEIVGPLFLFLGLFTLFNAPFDWASLGLTRALLRRGLELGGWWPYLLGIAGACLAGVIIALLAMTMVLGVQAFDELAIYGGGAKAAVLPLGPLFDGIAKNPGAPEYWWAYALLLSTMIPSLINLAIGGMALTRGVPGVSRLLLHWIPEGRDVPDYRRPLAALVLTGQMFAGAALGIAAQALVAWLLLFHLMPAYGLDLLRLCRWLAYLDLPGTFFHLTGIIR